MLMNRRISVGKRDGIERGEPWFDDGNIMLITAEQPTAYRLHRGVLARHSEIFSDMLEIPQPLTSETEFFDGCQVVCMYDMPSELSNLVKALYDGPKFLNTSVEDFFYLAGVLRLATKYFIGQLRRKAIQFLEQTWASTLKGHDLMVEAALNSPIIENLTYPYVHPLHVLNLAREVDIEIVVPSALYFLSLYPLSDILKGDHPKLLVNNSSRPSSILMSSDLQLYTLMFQHRLQVIDSFIRHFCGKRASDPPCRSVGTCGKGFQRLISQLHRSWTLRTGPLHYISQAMQQVSQDAAFCNLCRLDFLEETALLRQNIWDELPNIVNLSKWSEMHSS
ncbi:hypothetical protein B0H34DRAFT_859078 [Crassisporium funariophilum]|nr:hypothetical protein B0H34DRAFT_859078 [Crassisporium funariophilum]